MFLGGRFSKFIGSSGLARAWEVLPGKCDSASGRWAWGFCPKLTVGAFVRPGGAQGGVTGEKRRLEAQNPQEVQAGIMEI